MNGMEMMLKSLGFDPEKIKSELGAVLEQTTARVMQEVTALKESQLRTEQKIDKILANQNVLDRGLVIDNFDPTKESGMMDSLPSQ